MRSTPKESALIADTDPCTRVSENSWTDKHGGKELSIHPLTGFTPRRRYWPRWVVGKTAATPNHQLTLSWASLNDMPCPTNHTNKRTRTSDCTDLGCLSTTYPFFIEACLCITVRTSLSNSASQSAQHRMGPQDLHDATLARTTPAFP